MSEEEKETEDPELMVEIVEEIPKLINKKKKDKA